jgi:hypothetical protein
LNGADGAPGATGVTGAIGPTGADGVPGLDGINGIDGAPGVDGAPGAIGPTGPSSIPNLVTGVVDAGGLVVSGTGFTVTNGSVGIDNISFNTPFTGGLPTVLLTPVGTPGAAVGTIPPAANCSACYTDTGDDWITSVSINSIINGTGQDGSCSYGDYTALNTSLSPGLSYDLTVSFFSNGIWTECVSAWFDWNQNGDFEASERFDLGCGIDATFTLSIPVPLTALPGPTRMRVIEDFSVYATDACTGGSYGETEDYTVIIDGGGGLSNCNVSSVTTSGFQCNCENSSGNLTNVDYHFAVFGN